MHKNPDLLSQLISGPKIEPFLQPLVSHKGLQIVSKFS